MVRVPSMFHALFRDVVFRMPEHEQVLYLTFDDGPNQGTTGKILELLDRYHAKGTFFVCGREAENNRLLLDRIIDQGHMVGNHSFTHPNGWKTRTSRYLYDIQKADLLLSSPFFRPPFGKLTWRQYRYLRKHYRIIIWDIMCMDFKRISPGECYANISRHARPGSVIVFHDTPEASCNMLYALEKTLAEYGKKGYRFETIF